MKKPNSLLDFDTTSAKAKKVQRMEKELFHTKIHQHKSQQLSTKKLCKLTSQGLEEENFTPKLKFNVQPKKLRRFATHIDILNYKDYL